MEQSQQLTSLSDDSPQKLTEYEQQGVKAIIKLQGLANIPETEQQALAGWRSMSEHQQQFTLKFAGMNENAIRSLAKLAGVKELE